jgi:hypothetical protein
LLPTFPGPNLSSAQQGSKQFLVKETAMGLILLIIAVALLLGSLPAYPYSRGWGYQPSGLLSLLVIILLAMILFGGLPWWGPTPVGTPVTTP